MTNAGRASVRPAAAPLPHPSHHVQPAHHTARPRCTSHHAPGLAHDILCLSIFQVFWNTVSVTVTVSVTSRSVPSPIPPPGTHPVPKEQDRETAVQPLPGSCGHPSSREAGAKWGGPSPLPRRSASQWSGRAGAEGTWGRWGWWAWWGW